jgi:hypothetical protein
MAHAAAFKAGLVHGLPDQPVAMLAAASHGTCFTGATSSAVDMAKAPNALGPVGNFFMATLLILLCGLSLLSTVGRQFQVSCRRCPPPVVIAATSGVALMSATFAFRAFVCRRTWCR